MDEFDAEDDVVFTPRPDLVGHEEKCPICRHFIRATSVVQASSDGGLQIEFDCPHCHKTSCLLTDEPLPDRCKVDLALPLELQIRLRGPGH